VYSDDILGDQSVQPSCETQRLLLCGGGFLRFLPISQTVNFTMHFLCKEERTPKAMVMRIVVVEGERPTRDKGVRCEHGAHRRPYSTCMMSFPTENVPLSVMVVGDNEGTRISTTTGADSGLVLILSYRHQINTWWQSLSYSIKQLNMALLQS